MRRMCFSALTVFASLALVGSAAATDLPPRPYPVKAPPMMSPPVIYNWSGFYLGVSFGGSFGKQAASASPIGTGATVASGSADMNDAIVGDTIGFNIQSGPLVYGIEADFQGSWENGEGVFTATGPTTTFDYTARLRWFGTVRGRIGCAFDRLLPYVTGGWAYGRGRIEASTRAPAVANTSFVTEDNYTGWTIGAGLEWAFYDNWSAKLEYLYMDLGSGDRVTASTAYNFTPSGLTENIVRVGVNYRF